MSFFRVNDRDTKARITSIEKQITSLKTELNELDYRISMAGKEKDADDTKWYHIKEKTQQVKDHRDEKHALKKSAKDINLEIKKLEAEKQILAANTKLSKPRVALVSVAGVILLTIFVILAIADDRNSAEAAESTSVPTESVSDISQPVSDVSKPVKEATSSAVTVPVTQAYSPEKAAESVSPDSIPAYSGKPYVAINGNTPVFSKDEKALSYGYEYYSPLDRLGRCGVTLAVAGKETMPTEERGPIGSVKPTGWHTVKYSIVDGNYLYNRCHLIGYQLTAENANVNNLITGTRYLNVTGMLPFENMVADYIKETGNHALYRVTPIFDGNNLLATGVQMEAWSLEDNGSGICFNVFCYNVQPGITIDYSDGESRLTENQTEKSKSATESATNKSGSSGTNSSEGQSASTTKSNTSQSSDNNREATYIVNTNSGVFHYPNCPSVARMSERNKQVCHCSRESLINQGRRPCQNCNP